jgi:DNA-binding NarL/FixJ family response regulator
METLGRIAIKHKGIPIILYSFSPNYKQDFMSWTAEAYLAKSSDFTVLKQTVRTLMEKKKRKGIDS